jgi:hypothetical protein
MSALPQCRRRVHEATHTSRKLDRAWLYTILRYDFDIKLENTMPVFSITIPDPTQSSLDQLLIPYEAPLLRGPHRLPLAGRQPRRTAVGGMDTGMSRHHLCLGLPKKNPILIS